jgi:hypothetical protein
MRLMRDANIAFGVAGLGKLFCQVSCPKGGSASGTSEAICATACPGQTVVSQTSKTPKSDTPSRQDRRGGSGGGGASVKSTVRSGGNASTITPLAAVGATLGALALLGVGALLLKGKK